MFAGCSRKGDRTCARMVTSRRVGGVVARDVETFNAQYPELKVHYTKAFHDRFLILDDSEGYLVGASLKDAGKRSFAVARIEDQSIIGAILSKLAEQWQPPRTYRGCRAPLARTGAQPQQQGKGCRDHAQAHGQQVGDRLDQIVPRHFSSSFTHFCTAV